MTEDIACVQYAGAVQLADLMRRLRATDASVARSIGVSLTTIFRIRTGRVRPSGSVLQALNDWAASHHYKLDWSHLRAARKGPAARGSRPVRHPGRR